MRQDSTALCRVLQKTESHLFPWRKIVPMRIRTKKVKGSRNTVGQKMKDFDMIFSDIGNHSYWEPSPFMQKL